jgi:hypothetical protein
VATDWRICTTRDITTLWRWLTVNTPAWSDATGWHDVTNYSTIQTDVIGNRLFLLAVAMPGSTLGVRHRRRPLSKLASHSPGWSDAAGWDDAANYPTIHTAVVGDQLFLLARANAGIHT